MRGLTPGEPLSLKRAESGGTHDYFLLTQVHISLHLIYLFTLVNRKKLKNKRCKHVEANGLHYDVHKNFTTCILLLHSFLKNS